MSSLNRSLKQKAVYWARSGSDGYEDTFSEAVEVSVRWSEKNELFIDAIGKEKVSSAVALISADVAVSGYVCLCSLDDLDSNQYDNPKEVEGAYRIQAFQKVSNMSVTDYVRKIWL